MRNFCFIIGIGMFMFFASACEKYLEYDGDNAEPRLVLNGICITDSVFRVELSHSLGYNVEGPLNEITNAKVAVFDGNGIFIDSLYHEEKGVYSGVEQAATGKTYTVVASAPSYENIRATNMIPLPVPIINVDTVSYTDPNSDFYFGSERIQIDFTIADPGGIENYYAIEVYGIISYYLDYIYDPDTGDYTTDTVYYDEPIRDHMYIQTSDVILTEEKDLEIDEDVYYAGSILFADHVFNGKTQTLRIAINLNDYYEFTGIELSLKSCSEAYYKYFKSLETYFGVEGNPFAEPVQVYTNIENGLGIWGGYSVATYSF